ncbi:MAG: sigma-54-dependent Fis family transcriptional regulator [Proteobacteria bacterium]|nr:sigma-54-dependent Fis family transcriptional regulator [Pseudomonadota bacterium]
MGRPVVIPDRVTDDDLVRNISSATGDGAKSTSVSRDILVSQGASALADILMRACLEHPQLAAELAALKPVERTDGPEVKSTLAMAGDQADEPYMVGSCQAMQVVFHAIRRFASTDAPILVTGESGTGKELAARAIHERSQYSRGPFVAVNCGGLPASLIASELFGHEKGAFTGALSRRIGRIEEANNGTLFLDEMGDLPMELQANLLRFLQDKTIERVGSNAQHHIHTRIIAATNVQLEQAVTEGRFRQDLFFRLDVLRVHLPPLRERDGDIELMIKFFLNQAAREFNLDSPPMLVGSCLAALRHYSWPGNVRELISKMRRAVIMAGDRPLEIDDFDLNGPPAHCGPSSSVNGTAPLAAPMAAAPDNSRARLSDARARAEEAAVRAALEKYHFNVTRASKDLGVSRVTMYKLMDRYNIQR